MPWQLIYTSALRGLASGQSGFCTVARSADLRDAVAQRLEQLSSYHYLELSSAASATRNPTISAYRILDIRGSKYHALTRIQPSGLDFTARTNHLAQHLVFQPEELARLQSPAAILRHWTGWLTSWQGEPRLLDPLTIESFAGMQGPSWPAQTWAQVSGDAGRAAGLLEGECLRGCYLLCPPGTEQQLLDLFRETLQLPNWTGKYPLRAWQHTFTTFLQGVDSPADFQWRGCREGTPAHELALRRSAQVLPVQSIRIPNNPLARIAREGAKPTTSGPVAPTPGRPLPARKGQAWRPMGTDVSQAVARAAESDDVEPEQSSILSNPVFRAVGIAVVLLIGLLLSQHYLSKRSHRPLSQTGVKTVETNVEQATAAASTNTPETSAPVIIQREPLPSHRPKTMTDNRSKLDQMKKILPDVTTYLAVVPATTNSVDIRGARLLEQLVDRLQDAGFLGNYISVSLETDTWGVDTNSRTALRVDNRRNQQQLVLDQGASVKIAFDYGNSSRASADKEIRLEAAFVKPPKAYAIYFQPTRDDQTFAPFRMLVVADASPPAPLGLDGFFLRKAGSFRDSLNQLLRDRLDRFDLLNSSSWQLRPFILGSGAVVPTYLYAGWPQDEQPKLGGETDFPAVRAALREKLKTLGGTLTNLDALINNFAATGDAVADRGRPVAEDLGVTNQSLLSFTNFDSVPNYPSATRYRQYLGTLAGKTVSNAVQNWHFLGRDGKPASPTASLTDDLVSQALYDLYVHWPHKIPTNYFNGVWRSLRLDDIRRERQQVADNIESVTARLADVPTGTDATAYVGLFVVGSHRVLEVIHFSNSDNGATASTAGNNLDGK